MTKILGIDVGATGTKGAIVDVSTGELLSDRIKLKTPKKGKPEEIAEVVNELRNKFEWNEKPIGMGFPAAIMGNIVKTASNIHKSWIGVDVIKLMEEKTNCPTVVINDADAAGIAEVSFGQGLNVPGTVLLITLGTGIGSAIFSNGELVPNTEFGHILFKGGIAEKFVSNSARTQQELDWREYGQRLGEFLEYMNRLLFPELIILGGGISKKFNNYNKYFPENINVKPASKFNNSGIIGAAMAYHRKGK